MTEKKKAAKNVQPKQKTAKKGTKPSLVKKPKPVEEEESYTDFIDWADDISIPKSVLRKVYWNMVVSSVKGLFRNLF